MTGRLAQDIVENFVKISPPGRGGGVFLIPNLVACTCAGFETKYVDFSTSYSIIGNFLRNLGSSNGGTLVEVLILRDCMHLKER
ncbi:hypothetical protein K1719_003744 [Acacia pycnantha]|nr:hypothetical protein K1719_003744 [Acacia pycnantha]